MALFRTMGSTHPRQEADRLHGPVPEDGGRPKARADGGHPQVAVDGLHLGELPGRRRHGGPVSGRQASKQGRRHKRHEEANRGAGPHLVEETRVVSLRGPEPIPLMVQVCLQAWCPAALLWPHPVANPKSPILDRSKRRPPTAKLCRRPWLCDFLTNQNRQRVHAPSGGATPFDNWPPCQACASGKKRAVLTAGTLAASRHPCQNRRCCTHCTA
jgi:hypothetical protein